MPFGLCNAPVTFQRYMDLVFAVIKWICFLVYIDDIIVFSKTFEQHIADLVEVFERLRAHNLTLKASKCFFCQPKLVPYSPYSRVICELVSQVEGRWFESLSGMEISGFLLYGTQAVCIHVHMRRVSISSRMQLYQCKFADVSVSFDHAQDVCESNSNLLPDLIPSQF
jgi:hypothetical protein